MFILFLLFMSLQTMQNIYSASNASSPASDISFSTTPTLNTSSLDASSDEAESTKPQNPYENKVEVIAEFLLAEYQERSNKVNKLLPKNSQKLPQNIYRMTRQHILTLEKTLQENTAPKLQEAIKEIMSTIKKYKIFEELEPYTEYITLLNTDNNNCYETILLKETICSILSELAQNGSSDISVQTLEKQILKTTGPYLLQNLSLPEHLINLLDAAREIAPLSKDHDEALIQRELCYALHEDMLQANKNKATNKDDLYRVYELCQQFSRSSFFESPNLRTNDRELNSRKRKRSF